MEHGFAKRTETLYLPSLRRRAVVASGLIALVCLLGVLMAVKTREVLTGARRLTATQTDDGPLSAEHAVRDTVDLLNRANSAAGSVFLYLIAVLATGVGYLAWLWRARLSAELVAPDGHRHRRGWTLGGWVCPVVNLWFPFRIVRDIWYASQPPGQRVRATVVGLWWVTWLVSFAASVVVRWMIPNQVDSLSEFVDAAERVSGITAFSAATNCVCGVLAIRIVWRITRWQAIPRQG